MRRASIKLRKLYHNTLEVSTIILKTMVFEEYLDKFAPFLDNEDVLKGSGRYASYTFAPGVWQLH